ncbi:hypothetical protein GW17_00007221 [Ensete ventricosum]|nr:hypothetical protein GW17_00007221 [Ensete ventricosum]
MSTRRGSTDVHEFDGQFRGYHVRYKVTSVIGHVFRLPSLFLKFYLHFCGIILIVLLLLHIFVGICTMKLKVVPTWYYGWIVTVKVKIYAMKKEEEEATEEEEEEEEKVLLEMWRCAVRSLSDSCLVATYVRSIDCSIGGDTREPRGPRHSLEKWELGFPTSHMWQIGLW